MLGILAALATEARCLVEGEISPRQVIPHGDTSVYVCGIGAERARAGALTLLSAGARALVSWGTAGALAPTLSPGALIAPRALIVGGRILGVDAAWHECLLRCLQDHVSVCTGNMTQAQAVLRTPRQKAAWFQATGAVAVDMESAAVAQAAASAGVPFLIVRGIVDPQSSSIPACVLEAVDEDGLTHVPKLVRGLLRRPADLRPLVRLARDFRAALQTLKTVVRCAGPRLCYDHGGPKPSGFPS